MARQHTQKCSVAQFLNVFGDSWTLMIMREAFYGATRFGQFQKNTGIAKNLLSERLAGLVAQGLLEKQDIGERGCRYAYVLTTKGLSLAPVITTIVQWSNEHLYGPGHEPLLLVDRNTGQTLPPLHPRNQDGEELEWTDIVPTPGPGADKYTLRRIEQSHTDQRPNSN